jgi:hypothetical protein
MTDTILNSEEAREEGRQVLADSTREVREIMEALELVGGDDVDQLAGFLITKIHLGCCADTLQVSSQLVAAMFIIRDLQDGSGDAQP